MTRWFVSLALALALALAVAAVPAHATVLTFDNGDTTSPQLCSNELAGTGPLQTCTNGLLFSQSYGDQPGLLDVRYDTPRVSPGVPMDRTLQWWATGYNDLFGVLWAFNSDANSEARIDLAPLQPGLGVRLNAFDLGAYPNNRLSTTAEVRDLLTDQLLWSFEGSVGNVTGTLNQHSAFSPDVYSVNGLRISWRDSAFNVGIDNVDFTLDRPSVNRVPEPDGAVAWVALAALAGAGWRRRGRGRGRGCAGA